MAEDTPEIVPSPPGHGNDAFRLRQSLPGCTGRMVPFVDVNEFRRDPVPRKGGSDGAFGLVTVLTARTAVQDDNSALR